jgi:hypothetical protein
MTKENVETVYGIECDVRDHDGYPTLIFGGALVDDDDSVSDMGAFEKESGFWSSLKNAFKSDVKHHHHEKKE